jgi:hypothetical protein
MEFTKFQHQPEGRYRCIFFSNDKMGNLGFFFATDVGCPAECWNDWILNDELGDEVGGNATFLEKEDNYIYIDDLYDADGNLNRSSNISDRLKISRTNLLQLLHDWKEKVCKKEPQEATITYENDFFTLTTSDEICYKKTS